MMDNTQQTEKQQFVEDFGLFFEQVGMPRMAGRILGQLLLSNPPHQSMDELSAVLPASKGSVSTMTRLLIQIGLIERISLPGVHHDYFRIGRGALQHLLKQRAGQVTMLRQLAERALKLIGEEASLSRQSLLEMRDMYIFFEREFGTLVERWEQEYNNIRKQFVQDGGSQ